MNPPSERRFPRLPLAKAEAGASPGAAIFLEDLIDACVMESYFREHMAERDLLFHDTVAPRPPRCLRFPRPPVVLANRFRLKLVAPALNWYPGWGSNPQDFRR